MNKVINKHNTCIREDLSSAVFWETFFGYCSNQCVLPILKDGDFILGCLTCVQMIISVWNKAGARNYLPNSLSGLFAPVTVLQFLGSIHVHVVVAADKLNLSTWAGLYCLINSGILASAMVSSSLIHIGNISKDMIPQTGGKSNPRMSILLDFMRFFKDRDTSDEQDVSV